MPLDFERHLKCSFSKDPRADQVSQGFAEKRRQRARRLVQDAFLDEDWLGDQGVAFKMEERNDRG